MTASTYDFSEFTRRIDERFDRNDLDTFWGCEEPFRELIASSFVVEAINLQLQQLKENPLHIGDWQPKQFIVHRGAGWALSIALFDSTKAYIHTSPYVGLYAPVGEGVLIYDLYELPRGYRNEVFDPQLKLRRAGSGEVREGEMLRVDSREYAYDFKGSSPALVVKLTCAPFQSLEWLFNKESLYAWQANDAEVRATQARVAAYLLGRLAHQSSLEPLEQLTSHPNHAVRWAAIQNIGRLSQKVALQKLEAALSDAHPHIRRAAEKTLQQLNRKLAK